MAQAKQQTNPEAVCASCKEPFRKHGSVWQRACDRFRQADDRTWSVMDRCKTIVRRWPANE